MSNKIPCERSCTLSFRGRSVALKRNCPPNLGDKRHPLILEKKSAEAGNNSLQMALAATINIGLL